MASAASVRPWKSEVAEAEPMLYQTGHVMPGHSDFDGNFRVSRLLSFVVRPQNKPLGFVMSFRDQTAGHATLQEGDFKQLENLPKPVAFQVRMFQNKEQKIWFVGTRNNLKKWAKDDTP